MIPVTRLLYKLDMKLNKLATNEHQSISDANKILALNEAQLKLLKYKAESFDSIKSIYKDLQILVLPNEELSVMKTNDVYHSFTASLDDLSKEFYLILEGMTLCSKDGCKDRPVYIPRIVKHGDVYTWYKNTNTAPSFEYQETIATISKGKLYIYTDGTFTVDKLYVTYVRYPQKINIAGYIDFDGTPSFDQDCELYDELEDELLNLAVLELAINTENIPLVQLSGARNKK
jgi:hypothetical protein